MVNLSPTQLTGSISLSGIMNGIGWLIAGVLVVAAIAACIWWYYNKRIFSKIVTRFEVIGDRYDPTLRDTAKIVKIGKGGFEVLYWRKAKVYRIAFGERIGRNTYYFFVAADGYEYNGVLGKNITIDGRIPIITANPAMRAQYTSLEKQIDALHGEKVGFWDKYGNWVITVGFVLIIGIFSYLFYKEWAQTVGQMPGLIKSLADLTDKINRLLVAADGQNATAILRQV